MGAAPSAPAWPSCAARRRRAPAPRPGSRWVGPIADARRRTSPSTPGARTPGACSRSRSTAPTARATPSPSLRRARTAGRELGVDPGPRPRAAWSPTSSTATSRTRAGRPRLGRTPRPPARTVGARARLESDDRACSARWPLTGGGGLDGGAAGSVRGDRRRGGARRPGAHRPRRSAPTTSPASGPAPTTRRQAATIVAAAERLLQPSPAAPARGCWPRSRSSRAAPPTAPPRPPKPRRSPGRSTTRGCSRSPSTASSCRACHHRQRARPRWHRRGDRRGRAHGRAGDERGARPPDPHPGALRARRLPDRVAHADAADELDRAARTTADVGVHHVVPAHVHRRVRRPAAR